MSRPDGTYVTSDGGALSGLTPGTAYANRPLVLGASKEIATITSATITTLTTPNFAGPESHAGIITPAAGVAAAGGFSASPRSLWIGQTAPQVSTDFKQFHTGHYRNIRLGNLRALQHDHYGGGPCSMAQT
jgi:hypothetical protein